MTRTKDAIEVVKLKFSPELPVKTKIESRIPANSAPQTCTQSHPGRLCAPKTIQAYCSAKGISKHIYSECLLLKLAKILMRQIYVYRAEKAIFRLYDKNTR